MRRILGVIAQSLIAQRFKVVVVVFVVSNLVWATNAYIVSHQMDRRSTTDAVSFKDDDETEDHKQLEESKDGAIDEVVPENTDIVVPTTDPSSPTPLAVGSKPVAQQSASSSPPPAAQPAPASSPPPASTQYVVDVKVATAGELINVIDVVVTYSTSELQFKSIVGAGDCFSGTVMGAASAGSAAITRYSGAGQSTTCASGVVARVTFEKLSSGTPSSLRIGSGSQVVRTSDSTNILGVVPGVSLYF